MLASVALLVGVRAAVRSPRWSDPGDPPATRFLVSVHHAAGAGFWLSLGGVFLVFAFAENAAAWRGLAIVPILMAGLRMLAAAGLSRR